MTCAAHSNAELWLSWLLYIVEVSISNLQRLIRDDHKTPHAVQHSPAAAAAAAAVTPWTQLSPHLLAVLTNTKTDLTAIIAAAWMQRQAQVPSPPRTPCPAATALPLFQAKQPRIVLGHLTHSPPRLNLASLHSVLRHTSSAQRGLQQLYLHMLQTRQQQAQLLLGDRSDKGAGQDPAAHTALQQWQPNPLWELDNNSEQGEEEKNAQELGTPQPSVPTFETAVSPSPPPCVPAGSLRDTAAAQPVSGLPPGDHNAFDWFCPTCALPATQLMVALVDADTRVAAARAQLAAAQGDINRLLGVVEAQQLLLDALGLTGQGAGVTQTQHASEHSHCSSSGANSACSSSTGAKSSRSTGYFSCGSSSAGCGDWVVTVEPPGALVHVTVSRSRGSVCCDSSNGSSSSSSGCGVAGAPATFK